MFSHALHLDRSRVYGVHIRNVGEGFAQLLFGVANHALHSLDVGDRASVVLVFGPF